MARLGPDNLAEELPLFGVMAQSQCDPTTEFDPMRTSELVVASGNDFIADVDADDEHVRFRG